MKSPAVLVVLASLVVLYTLSTCPVEAGVAYCWGDNADVQLGVAVTGNRNVPTKASTNHQWSLLAQGSGHACGLTPFEELYCWGKGTKGQLGNGGFASSQSLVSVKTNVSLVSLEAGGNFTCGLTKEGNAWCWGSGTSGTLGQGNEIDSPIPLSIGGPKYLKLATGLRHTCAVTTSYDIYCWGRNNFGQMGNAQTSSTVFTSTPSPILSNGNHFVDICSGEDHLCAVATDGTVYCWGRGDAHQLGNGQLGSLNIPLPVIASTRFKAVKCGGNHACGLGTDGKVYCWGSNANGQVGNGGTANVQQATQVNLRWDYLTLGRSHSCLIDLSGIAQCWGLGGSGQLGTGSNANQNNPIAIGSPNNIYGSLYLSRLGDFSCGLKSHEWRNFRYAVTAASSSSCNLGIQIPDNVALQVAWSSGTSNIVVTPKMSTEGELKSALRLNNVAYNEASAVNYPSFPQATIANGQLVGLIWSGGSDGVFSVNGTTISLSKGSLTCNFRLSLALMAEEECGLFPASSHTSEPPKLNFRKSGFKSMDMLTLVVESSVITGRSLLDIRMVDDNSQGCNNWTRSVANCTESYAFTKNFGDVVHRCLRNATVDTTSDPDYRQYRGQVSVSYYEELSDMELPATRDIRSILRPIHEELQFKVRFPKQAIFLSSNQTLSLEISGNTTYTFSSTYAVVSQRVILQQPQTNSYGIVILASLTKAPFLMKEPRITNAIPALVSSIESMLGDPLHVSNCPLDGVSDCLQYWKITINVTSLSQCDLNDIYTVNFVIGCASPLCPPPYGTLTDVVLDLKTSSFCPDVVEDVAFNGVLGVYSDPDRLVTANEWPGGAAKMAYFEIQGNSPDASLSSAAVSEIVIYLNGEPSTTLISGGILTPTGTMVKFSQKASTISGGGSGVSLQFQFFLNTLFKTATDVMRIKVQISLAFTNARRAVRLVSMDLRRDDDPSQRYTLFSEFQRLIPQITSEENQPAAEQESILTVIVGVLGSLLGVSSLVLAVLVVVIVFFIKRRRAELKREEAQRAQEEERFL